jgi:hypothetical protein
MLRGVEVVAAGRVVRLKEEGRRGQASLAGGPAEATGRVDR